MPLVYQTKEVCLLHVKWLVFKPLVVGLVQWAVLFKTHIQQMILGK